MSQEWKCKKLQIIYIIVAAMDKDIAATAAKDVHLVPDEIADDNADEHACTRSSRCQYVLLLRRVLNKICHDHLVF